MSDRGDWMQTFTGRLWKPGPDLLHAIGVRLADRPDELIEQLRRERVAREGVNRGA